MRRSHLGCLALSLWAACGDEDYKRPLELEYLTQAILAPSCGTAACHSSARQASGLALDTPDAARSAMVDDLLRFDSLQYDPAAPERSRLLTWVTEVDPEGLGIGRMPFDAPLPEKDIELLAEWVAAEAPGAQCDPAQNDGLACNDDRVVECSPDWSFGQTRLVCPKGCTVGPGRTSTGAPDPRWCRP